MADLIKQIKEFPQKPDFGDGDLLLIQGQGTTYNVQGQAVKKYAEDSAKPQVELAKKEAQAAAAAASRAEAAIQHPAIPDPETGNWLVWDQVSESYQQTEPPVRAEGQDFEIRGYYSTLEALEAAVSEPEKGYAYGVGTEVPYDIYVWDVVHSVWVNNGPMTTSGDMLKSKYDPQHKEQDIFAYADAAKQAALDADVGRSMAGKTVEPTQGTTVTAEAGAEVFNDYRERTYGTDEGYETIIPRSGNIASGLYSHAEGEFSTASGRNAHAEGVGTTASGNSAHAEGVSTQASNSGAHSEGRGTKAEGLGAHAEGVNTTASKDCSHAEGSATQAMGQNSHAEGYRGIAEGSASHVEGGQITDKAVNKASGYAAHAEGASTLASGAQSHAEGEQTTAAGRDSHAEGYRTTASKDYSHAEGDNNHAEGNNSHAEGKETQALSVCSHTGGIGTVAEYYAEMAIGKWNVKKNPDKYTYSGDLFVVGMGNSETERANTFRVNHGGVYGTSAFNSSGADYAELFEWADGNPEAQDRAGRFVTLEGVNIRLAGPGDGYILGIVSGAPSVVGDVFDDQWQGMYLTDVLGRPIWEDVEVPAVTEEVETPVEVPGEGEEAPRVETRKEVRVVIPARTERRQKLNPDYDPGQTYVPRSERPEWDAVGMLGKLVAVDDGSCRVNGWATVGEGGAATNSEERTQYRVMARLDDRHVRILIL